MFLALLAAVVIGDGRSQAADVEITGPVDLGAGPGSAHVGSAVSVSGTISSTTGVWTVNNDGSVTGGPALQFLLGGTINNAAGAIITATGFNSAIELGDYDYPYSGIGEGFVNNYGTITGGTFADGVALYGGGIVTNFLGGHITSASSQGAVSLSGGTSRSVVNSGEISNTGSSFATGVVIQGGAGSITNNASGTIYGAYNGIWTNGSTPLTLINDGSITSTRGAAVELGGGGSVTNTGTVSSPFDGLLITGAATVTNTGTVESTGSGKSILFSGGAAHTLNLGTGSVLNGNVQGGTGTDNLVLQGTGTESAAKFLGFETLDMQGTDWTLTGTGTFTTSATVTSGRLAVNGDLTIDTGIGPLSILSGGILGGSGAINGTVTNGGTIAPGNSIGTLTVANVIFSPHSLFSVQIDPPAVIEPSHSDELVVEDTATIVDSTAMVSVSAAPGTYTAGTRYLILDAHTRSGEFGGVTDNSAFLDFTLDQTIANQVWLQITTVADFASVAQTPNQKAAAGGVQPLGPGNGVYDAVVALDASTARGAFDQLSGEIHASTKGALLDQSRFMREATLGRLGERLDPALFQPAPLAYASPAARPAMPSWPGTPGGGGFSAWGQVFGSDATHSGDGNAAGLDRQIGGFFAGGDWTGDSGWRFGVATGVDAATIDEPARASTASVSGTHLAAYGGLDGGAFAVRGGAAIAWQDIATRRGVAFPGYTDTLTAAYGARTMQVYGEVARPFALGGAKLEPFAGAAWVGADVDGFTERGGAAALSAPTSHASTTLTTLGLRYDRPLDLGGTSAWLTGAIAWQHAFGGLAPTSDLAFAGGTPFTIAGTPRAADVLKLDLGLVAALGPRAVGRLSYSGEIGDGVQDHALTGRVTIGF